MGFVHPLLFDPGRKVTNSPSFAFLAKSLRCSSTKGRAIKLNGSPKIPTCIFFDIHIITAKGHILIEIVMFGRLSI